MGLFNMVEQWPICGQADNMDHRMETQERLIQEKSIDELKIMLVKNLENS